MEIKANVASAFPGKFYVQVKFGSLKEGRGIKEQSSSVEGVKKYLITAKEFEKLSEAYKIKFENVLN